MDRSLNLCGKFPFTTPYFFGLTICCNTHDNDYELLRYRCLFEFKEQDPYGYLPLFIKEKNYWYDIALADEHFYSCMKAYLNESGAIKRLVLIPFVFYFEKIVRKVGFDIWHEGTIKEWEERYNG